MCVIPLQVYSCEKVDWKRLFILANEGDTFHPIFEDITQLHHGNHTGLKCKMTGNLFPVASADILVVCCSCTSLSGLNMQSKSISHTALSTGKGSSGETFKGLINLLSVATYDEVWMENVPEFVKGSFESDSKMIETFDANGPALKAAFADLGFFIGWLRLCPSQLKEAQTRNRVICRALRLAKYADAERRIAHWKEMVSHIVQGFSAVSARPLDNYLLNEDDPRVLRARNAQKASPEAPEVTEPQKSLWVYVHEEFCENNNIDKIKAIRHKGLCGTCPYNHEAESNPWYAGISDRGKFFFGMLGQSAPAFGGGR